jgi:hypothetical protein
MLEPDPFTGRAPKKIKQYLADLRTALISRTPLKGSGIVLSEHTDGVEIAVDNAAKTGAASCAPTAPPASGTWVWGSVNGNCQWIDTTTCP